MKKSLLLLTIFMSTLSFAQRGGIKGRVLDETKHPLPGATVLITETKTGTATDFDGNYELLNIANGTYKVSVSFIGYKTIEETITITNGTTEKNFNLLPQTNELDEVVILGSIAKGQAKALNKQKTNENITNVISSDQVGKFPDANIGDALKRVPGIAMQNDQGEARNIIVRGLAPELNSVTLNGDRLPSAEGSNRRVQMDLIPSDMIQTIEVSKAVTPDMEADAIGGSVNLVTRSAPSTFRASLTGSYGMNPVRDGSNYTLSGIVAGRTKNQKVGAVFNASYNSNDYGSDNIEFEWKKAKNDQIYIGEQDIRRYDVKRVRKSIGLNLDWKPSANHTFDFKSMYNERDDYENRFRTRIRKVKVPDANGISKAEIRRQTKGGIDNDVNNNTRLEEQAVYKLSLGGKHILFNDVKVKWKAGVSRAQEERPNERYIRFERKSKKDGSDGIKVKQDFSEKKFPILVPTNDNYNTPSFLKFSKVDEEKRFTRERKLSSKIDIDIPLTTEGDYQNKLKLGYKYNNKSKLRDNNYYSYKDLGISTMEDVPYKDYTINGYLAGDKYKVGNFATTQFLGSLDLKDGKLVLEEFAPRNYNADESISAFYAMLKQDLGDKLSVIVGLRAESTSVDYTGYIYDSKGKAKALADLEKTYGSKNYTNWLPNIQAKYEFGKNTIARLAWTNTIARPNYYDLVPYVNVNSDKTKGSRGNPDLTAATSMNFDLMFEHYFANVGIISLGGFHKSVEDFIYKKVTKETLTIGGEVNEYNIEKPFNGNTANIYGFEVALQRKLNFLPSFLRNLTFYGNYTYTHSKTNGITGREDGLPLAGAIKNMINTSLAYETEKFTLRASLNYADDYIDEYGEEAFFDRYYDEQLFLDINTSYEIYEGLRLFVEAKNLTNQPLRYYQGTKDQTMQTEYYNYNWNAGLKYNF